MCYAVKCGTCALSTWAGCGRHVASVYTQIKPGQHCLCRPWPGVKLPDQAQLATAVGGTAEASAGATGSAADSPSLCIIS